MNSAGCNCRGCPSTRQECVSRPVKEAEVAIVFEYPSQEAALKDDFFSGKKGGASNLVKIMCDQLGIDLNTTYVCSAVNCRPNPKKEAMLKKAMLACRPRLVEELKEAGVKKVLCLGTIGFSALVSAERNLPITKFRGRWYQAFGMDILPTFSPNMVVASPDWFRDFAADFEKFATTAGRMPWPEVDLWIPESLKEAKEAFQWIKEASYVSLDLETGGLSPVSKEVIAQGIGVLHKDGDAGTTVIFDEALLEKKAVWRLTSELLGREDQPTVMHNAKFDLQFLKKGFLERGLKYKPGRIEDTMLLHYTIDERPMGKFKSHVLESLARVYFDAPDYGVDMKKWLKAWETVHEVEKRTMRKQLHVYLGLDCYYTARLFPTLWNEALEESEQLLDLYEDILLPGTFALADIELRGVCVDKEFYEEVNEKLKRKEKRIISKLQKLTGVKDFNPGSWVQVAEVLYEKMGFPIYKTQRRGKQQGGKTSGEVLTILKRKKPEAAPVVNEILLYRKVSKTRSTYAQGMLDRIDTDGRVHGNFNLHGTATGRLSSDDPNLQNIPDSSHTKIEVRNGFVATKGSVLIEADYSQLELRVAAWLSDCPDFKQVFIDGRDVHQEVTWALFEKEKKDATKYERYMAKCCNFGVMYARGPGSLANGPEMDYIEENGGERWSEAEVKDFFDKMLRNWPRYNEWMGEMSRKAYEDGYVDGPFGNKRRFPLIPPHDHGAVGRQGVNTPIQGTASHVTLSALIRIHNRLPEGAYIVSTVHDSILIECAKHLVDTVLRIVKEEMEVNLGFDPGGIPFEADADVANRWGEMGKYTWEEEVLVPVVADD